MNGPIGGFGHLCDRLASDQERAGDEQAVEEEGEGFDQVLFDSAGHGDSGSEERGRGEGAAAP